AHERIAARFLFGENARSLVFAGFRLDRLRAQELRRQYHLVAEDEAIDDEMMPIDLPAPGPLRRGRTHDAHPVIPLANMLVEPHYVARGLEAGGAEARAQQIERALALLGAEVLQEAAMPGHEDMHVVPSAPRPGLEIEQRRCALLARETGEKGIGGIAHALKR